MRFIKETFEYFPSVARILSQDGSPCRVYSSPFSRYLLRASIPLSLGSTYTLMVFAHSKDKLEHMPCLLYEH